MLIGIDASRALRTQRTGTERYAREIIRHLLQLPTALEHDWLLYAAESPVAHAARGLIFGGLFRRDGTRIASVAQEALIRDRRNK